MSTPIFGALNNIWPDASIDVLAIPETASVLKNNPHINKIYTFNKRKKTNKLKAFFPLVLALRKNKYDISFSIQSSLTSSLIMFLSGVKQRIGYETQKLLSQKVAIDRSLHIRDRVLLLVRNFTNKKLNNETVIYCSNSDIKKAKSLLKDSKAVLKIALAPGSVWATKKWPEKYFTELLKKCTKYSIYLIGGKDEYALCERIRMESGLKNIHNYAGQLSILESSALIKEMDLVICNDSAPLHMANAVKTNVFAFFGPTVKKFGCYPYRERDKILEVELDCRPCGKHGGNNCPLGHHQCIQNSKPEDIFTEIQHYFKTYKS